MDHATPGRDSAQAPKVSIVTVSFNSGATMRQTMQSVAAQTYGNIEHIVIDGGSTDATMDIVREFRGTRLSWVSEPDRGIYDAMNKGMQRASGDIIGILNSDDWLEPAAIEAVVKCFRDTGCDYTFGDTYLADLEGRRTGLMKSLDPREMGIEYLYKMPITHQTCYVSREVLRRVGSFSLEYRLSADHDFVVRLIGSGARGGRLPMPIATYRMGGSGGGPRTFQESRDIAIRYGMPRGQAYRRYLSSLLKITLVRVLPRPMIAAAMRAIGSRHVWY